MVDYIVKPIRDQELTYVLKTYYAWFYINVLII